jgi:voltage-gated potassium channel
VTTVGYGDIGPMTDTGCVIAMAVMLVGIGFVAILTAAAAERFMRSRREDERRTREQLDEMWPLARSSSGSADATSRSRPLHA